MKKKAITIVLQQTRHEVACTVRGRPSYRWSNHYIVCRNGVREFPPLPRAQAYARARELGATSIEVKL